MLSISVQDASAATFIDDGVLWLNGIEEDEAELVDVLLDVGGSPEVSFMPVRA